MDNKKILNDIYMDFFGESILTSNSKEFSTTTSEKETEFINLIDNLYLTDASKNLLKRIISYMERYYKKEESNYINFNISVEGNDKNTLFEINKILNYYSTKYNYTNENNYADISLYNINKAEDIVNYYQNNGIVIFRDLDAILLQDINFQKRFFHSIKDQITKKKITIIFGKKDTIKNFLQSDNELEKYFSFPLVCSTPSSNDVYQDILEKIGNLNLNEEFNIKLLDYIADTYPKNNLDYSTYITNLYNYISFNKDLPKVEVEKSIDEIFKYLNELVGLKKVKNTLNDLVNLITLKNKTKDDLKINNINLHMVFLGNPGTGKTTVARMIAEILYNLKYIRQNKLIEVSSKDLVAEYVGQTAVKTINVVEKAIGGILFIDEAYALADNNNENSYNGECIATLIKAMEDYRDDLVVIFAGYTKEMQDFLDSNSGIVSRIGYTLEFDDYTNEELKDIFKGMVNKAGFILEDNALEEVDKLINENRNNKNFGNARFIRNVFEKTVINHASNTKNNKNKKILKTITSKDIKY